jgi:hypothetical protein
MTERRDMTDPPLDDGSVRLLSDEEFAHTLKQAEKRDGHAHAFLRTLKLWWLRRRGKKDVLRRISPDRWEQL